jgi:hypothetical protein
METPLLKKGTKKIKQCGTYPRKSRREEWREEYGLGST